MSELVVFAVAAAAVVITWIVFPAESSLPFLAPKSDE